MCSPTRSTNARRPSSRKSSRRLVARAGVPLIQVAGALALLSVLVTCSLQATPARKESAPETAARQYLQALQDQQCQAVLNSVSSGFRQQTLTSFGGQDSFCTALKSHRRNRSYSIDSTNQSGNQAVVEASVQK